ncbi:Cell division control protein 7 [Coemansia spiralis]|uniref:non-specific serine/threonine protein kinase n=1 Tax=Coemansia spiralis TaxID=417178 RepID=A0A9W8GN81_9FUNG|nr:Cell division control protein 7 [Coemansia spiralis]
MHASSSQYTRATKRSREGSPLSPVANAPAVLFNSLGIPIVLPAPKRPRPLASTTVPLVVDLSTHSNQVDSQPMPAEPSTMHQPTTDIVSQAVSDGYDCGFDEARREAGDACADDVDDLRIHSQGPNVPFISESAVGDEYDEAGSGYDNLPLDDNETSPEDEEREGLADDHTDESDEADDNADLLDVDVESTLEEIEELEGLIPGLAEHYRLLGKIGQGTFSTVYKAIDLQHDRYDNSSWTMIFNEGSDDGNDSSDNAKPRARRRKDTARRARVVAIKKIYVTSSPTRIANEISILNDLKDSRFIAPLVTAMRKEDQVVVVLPYFPNDDFRRFYLDLPVEEMRWYFASLFSALSYAHSKGIMHRDIKPSNFLYDVRRRHGVLVDFGLAEREGDQEAAKHRSRHALQMDLSTAMRLFRSFDQKGRPGIPRKDTRPGLRANRAGTRGFRAPEVLLKIPEQSVAIDIWSVGVILLCFLTRRFPFFQSTDDTEALLEIAVLYGRLEMERAAVALGRSFLTNIPTVKDRGIKFESLAKAYNSEGYDNLPVEVFDLLRRLLTLDPVSRISAEQALEHSFIAQRAS